MVDADRTGFLCTGRTQGAPAMALSRHLPLRISQLSAGRTEPHTWRQATAHRRGLAASQAHVVCGVFASAQLTQRLASLRNARSRGSTGMAATAVAEPVVSQRSRRVKAVQVSDESSGSDRRWRKERLPISEILPDIMDAFQTDQDIVLQAPTGAGKTTIVPLALLEGGHVDGKVIVLQPRRITALSVAKRMADLWGEPVGETVGYRIRHESVVSNRTRIEVVTEGVLVRMLNGNPTLEGISCIFFDEFHERSVDSDLSFTLCLHLKRQRRVPVRMVVMSATFGALGEKVSSLLQNSRQIISKGRAYPVAVNYCGVLNLRNWEPRGPRDFANTVAKQIKIALDEHEGDALVFVPGEREIMYVWIALNNMGIGDGQRPKNLVPWAHRLIDDSKLDLSKKIQVSPLYGTMETHEQDAVITDSGDGWRKVILATSIAESSITVPTVRIVVDTGLRRVKAVDPTTSLSEMRTIPVSKAAAEQRRGRAGRVAAGVCYRLWSEEQQDGLSRTDDPELMREDLAMPVLALTVAGHSTTQEINALPWIDRPPLEAIDKARTLLTRLQVLERKPGGVWELTPRGELVSNLPVHPRIAHMVLQAQSVSDSFARDACDLAALLEEKEVLRGGRRAHGTDLQARMVALQDDAAGTSVMFTVRERILKASEQIQFLASLSKVEAGKAQRDWERKSLAVLIAWAFPELLAEAISDTEDKRGKYYKLVSGDEVFVDTKDKLAECNRLIVASATGGKVFWAMPADFQLLADYGIDASDPVNHKILSRRGSDEEGAKLDMPEVRRYFIGKNFDGAHSPEELVNYMGATPTEFPTRDVTDLMWDLARASDSQHDLMRLLLHKVIMSRCSEFAAAELAEVSCALAIAGVYDEECFTVLGDELHPRLEELVFDADGGCLSGLLWAFSEAGVAHTQLYKALAERAAQGMVDFEPKVLSDVREPCFWTFHRASAGVWSNRGSLENPRDFRGFAANEFYDHLAPLLLERINDIHPVCCVYFMWSFCKPLILCTDLFEAVAQKVVPEVQKLDRCGLAMFCWNYAYISHECAPVFESTAKDSLRTERLAELTPRDVAAISKAFAKAGVRNVELMQALCDHSCGLLRDGIDQKCYKRPMKSLARDVYEEDFSAVDGKVDAFDMVTLSDMLSSLADQQFVHPQFLQLADEYMQKGLQQPAHEVTKFLRFPQVFARALVARARAYIDPAGRQVFRSAMPHVVETLPVLGARDVVRLVAAWAMLGPKDEYALAKFENRLREVLDETGARLDDADVSAATWALAELGLDDRQLLQMLEAAREQPSFEF